MKYEKPPLTIEAQAELLIKRGLSGNPGLIKSRLAAVNYYRLSGYWYPFRNPDNDSFKPDTTFDNVWDLYVFDRRLRLLVMDAIERIEISVRAQLAYHHSHAYGAFGYATDRFSLPKFDISRYNDFISRVRDETERSKETFVEHFQSRYGDSHNMLPVWMSAEVMSFGTILTFFRGASHQVKQSIATSYKVPHTVFDSWLLTLNTIRNICAHHGRLWNRALGIKPLIPFEKKYPEWHQPVKISNNRIFGALTVCRHCLRCIAPQSHWDVRLKALLDEYKQIPRANMGFPEKWTDSPIWIDNIR